MSPARYGQHFLINNIAKDKIVDNLKLQPGDNLVEIGPGQGALTALLLNKGANCTAIEVDQKMVEKLQKQYGGKENLHLIHKDILAVDLETLGTGFKVVGNLPYNLTSPILRQLSNWKGWDFAVLMTQKEVGDRLCASVDTKKYGALTVGMSLTCESESLFDLDENSFRPPPKVKSVVVRVTRRKEPLTSQVGITQKVIQAAFQQRRKTILNSLSHGLSIPKEKVSEVLAKLGLKESLRAENLTVDSFVHLSHLFSDVIGPSH